MPYFRWFANLFTTTHSHKDRCRSVPPQRRVLLMLEQLEDRRTPSTMLAPTPMNFLLIEAAIIKQAPYLEYWNSWFQQNTGAQLPGVSEMFSLLKAEFPAMWNLVLNSPEYSGLPH